MDSAEYLDSEEAIVAYLEAARADGGLADALEVVARARVLNRARISVGSGSVRREVKMATNTGKDFRHGAVTGRTQFQRGDGLWQKRDERTGHFMEVKQSDGRFKGVAREPDGRDGKD